MTVDIERCAQIVKAALPGIDETIVEYVAAILGQEEDLLDDEEALFEAVSPVLLDVADDGEDTVRALCSKMAALSTKPKKKPTAAATAAASSAAAGGGKNGKSVKNGGQNNDDEEEGDEDNDNGNGNGNEDDDEDYDDDDDDDDNTGGSRKRIAGNGLMILNAPVQMKELMESGPRATMDISRTFNGRTHTSKVDQKKLEKAEQKLVQKAQLREKREIESQQKAEQDKIDAARQQAEEGSSSNATPNEAASKSRSRDIKVEDFDIFYAGKKILTNATISLAYGRRYGLVGRNGIGKSTLLRAISRREIPFPSHISVLHVEQEMAGDDTAALQSVVSADVERDTLLKEEKRLAAIVNGTGDGANATDAERDRASARLREVYGRLETIDANKAEAKASSILFGLGFTSEMQKRATKTFSGGWRMRLSLARALFMKPDLLLLDEPTNMLDIPAVNWLENYLVEQWNNTLLVVSHDREFLDEVGTDILHMHNERIDSYRGNFEAFVSAREERLKNQQREYEAQLQYRQHLQDFIDKWRYNAKRAPQAQSKLKILEKLPPLVPVVAEPAIQFVFPSPEKLPPPLIQMNDVTFNYPNGPTILQKINFGLTMESRVSIVGPNGAGKSTLLSLVTGRLEAVKGMCQRHGRLRIAFFSQHHVDQLDMDLNPVDFLAARFPGKSAEEYRRILGNFAVTGQMGLQPIRTLSGGQKSRVVFAAMAMQNPHMLILDEPTNHLDMDAIEALAQGLNEFVGGVIVVSHDERFIRAVCNELWVCEGGSVKVFPGEIKDYKAMLAAAAAASIN